MSGRGCYHSVVWRARQETHHPSRTQADPFLRPISTHCIPTLSHKVRLLAGYLADFQPLNCLKAVFSSFIPLAEQACLKIHIITTRMMEEIEITAICTTQGRKSNSSSNR